MSHLLRPGEHVMRRLRLPGKLALVAAVLLVPPLIAMADGALESNRQISSAQRERDGLRLVGALVRLEAQVALLRESAAAGRPAPAGITASMAGVDGADRELGDAFGVRGSWRATRAAITALLQAPPAPQTARVRLTEVSEQTRSMLAAVADESGLGLDPDVDGSHLGAVLVDRLPRLLGAVGLAQALRPDLATGGGTPRAGVERTIAIQDLTGLQAAIARDLQTAWTATSWSGLEPTSAPQAAALEATVQDMATRLEGAARGAAGPPPSGQAVAAAATALAASLADGTDTLLQQRQAALRRDRALPVTLTLLALLLAGYLYLALYRSTTRDARHVQEDIDTMTAGALHQTPPLTGVDEFSRMSQAVVVLRDRLTSLLGALRYQATHDELTALGNRALFTEKLEEALRSGHGGVAVVLVDLDGFKDFNDSFGHGTGDRLLRAAGVRFHRVARRDDLVARLGGDEFAVLLTGIKDADEAMLNVSRLQRSLEEPVELDGRRLRLRASVGVAIAGPGRATVLELMRNADVALYSAKDTAKGQAVLFERHMHDRTRERTELSTDLAQALEHDELAMAYQPIVDLASRQLVGVEALVRWLHPERGLVSPALFVPLAEASGLIRPIGRWVLQQAASQQAVWRDAFPDRRPLTMEVNVSAAQLTDESLVEDILAIIGETGIDPTALVLEITESALVEDVDTALRRLRQLAAIGVRIALDDFGTGYSSLSYLRQMPISVLKIDKSFIDGIEQSDGQSAALMRSIVGLAASLGMESIAEGIEHDVQAETLRGFGCHLGQGFLFAKPVHADELTERLRHERPRVPAPRR